MRAASTRILSSARRIAIVPVPLFAVSIALPSSLDVWLTRLISSIAAACWGEFGLIVASACAASPTSALRCGVNGRSRSRCDAAASSAGISDAIT